MIYIQGNVSSSKNSKQWTGKFLIWSKIALAYKKLCMPQLEANKAKWLKMVEGKPKPYKVGFYFIRDSQRKFDFINPIQTLADLMVQAGWLNDDNADEFLPVILGYEVNKARAGVIISLV